MLDPKLEIAGAIEPVETGLAAERIARGVMRMLDGLGFAAMREFPLRARRSRDRQASA